MNQDIIRNKVISLLNQEHVFLCKGCRNQNDTFRGKIIKCYPSIFIIELVNGSVKAFSYSDFGIKNVKIIS